MSAAESSLRLSIVVPTFNEAGNISELLRRVEEALGPIGWEVIFVDDDSPDGTAAIARKIAMNDRRIRCLLRVGRRGLSSATIEGMLASAAPAIAIMDGDLQHDERILPTMLHEIEANGADVVVGTRYRGGGSTGSWDKSRVAMSRLATVAAQATLRQRVSDPMSGFFMLDRSVLDLTVHGLSGLGYKILLDLLASANRPLSIVEVPYTFRNRLSGESKLDEFVIWEYGMMLADKTVGRFVPVRFLSFALIGALGVVVHLAVMAICLKLLDEGFTVAQSVATLVAIVFNFSLNNLLTYRDRRLRGWKWVRGLLSFMVLCGIGAISNVGVASYLFANQTQWILAALAGILVGAGWNYSATQFYTWGK